MSNKKSRITYMHDARAVAHLHEFSNGFRKLLALDALYIVHQVLY